ncbi:hypothetical protein [Streptomyces seoulensis]|uniref:hypothetical protein n=1 Tax=Streptomyces seoulensis TaxID=73044 RepID=UPI001FCCBA87|nr:hypothetical protein [Streptomyces seoulensis]BDH03699.1 hypothetical protein HEK131_09260 [Streptomyces seoulensis]
MDKGNIDTPDAGDLDAAARRYCAEEGWSLPDGGSPVRPAGLHGVEDLRRAVHAVGRGRRDPHDEIRRHIEERARALGLTAEIPSDWNADGSLSRGGRGGGRGGSSGPGSGCRR